MFLKQDAVGLEGWRAGYWQILAVKLRDLFRLDFGCRRHDGRSGVELSKVGRSDPAVKEGR